MRPSWIPQSIQRFRRDEGGQSLLTFALLFPLSLTVILVGVSIIQIMVIKSSISSGIYDAVQELTYTGGTVREEVWRSETLRTNIKNMIVTRMASGAFLQQYLSQGQSADSVVVTITYPDFESRQTLCDYSVPGESVHYDRLRFTVTASLSLNPFKHIPFYRGQDPQTEALGPLTLTEKASGYVDCPRWAPRQQREGCLFPGLCNIFNRD
jgi:Flp pilus assembly protein TadG